MPLHILQLIFEAQEHGHPGAESYIAVYNVNSYLWIHKLKYNYSFVAYDNRKGKDQLREPNTWDVAPEESLPFLHPKPEQYLKAMFLHVDLVSAVSIGRRWFPHHQTIEPWKTAPIY